jgi:hypothetical protein
MASPGGHVAGLGSEDGESGDARRETSPAGRVVRGWVRRFWRRGLRRTDGGGGGFSTRTTDR